MFLFNMRSDITGITEEQKIPDEMGSFCGLCNNKKKRDYLFWQIPEKAALLVGGQPFLSSIY